ncbi:synaptotagmin-like protein 2 isoform X2 [Corythoichthys intestinalis]|uniref:synaptotagmin-like protein 2 isoform X2 n=1 Tax=Corythoichthys intestinalis TaxID=161448 RepID=UPI0025A60C05|nr:synaptotagmin-like protein 2 isoform X2 [Corythoichthys intestinalis]
MIDLSYLTEEERGIIMTVLRRDAQLKQAEEQRIRKLESILSQGSSSDSKLKYLTGQWFYEAKSRRHMDKIHGSEIILASMKQRRTSEGSFRGERPRAPSSPTSDMEVRQRPVRSLDTPLKEKNVQKQDLKSVVYSPRMIRQNPFNRASLIVVEPSEECFETDPTSPPNSQKTGGSSQRSGTSVTSEGSPVALKPIPRKRTHLSMRTPSQSDSSSIALDHRVAPAPRPSLHPGSSGSSTRSKTEATVSFQPNASADFPQQPPCDGSHVLSHSSLDGRKASSIRAEREIASMTEDNPTIGKDLMKEGMLDHDPVISNSVVSSLKEPEWQRTGAEPPKSYDIKFIESSDQKKQKRSQKKHSYKLTTPASSPTGNDENSISKVLDWFNRSTDDNDWLDGKDGSAVSRDTQRLCETNALGGEEIIKKDIGDTQRLSETNALGDEDIIKKEIGSIQKKEETDIIKVESEGNAKEVTMDAKNNYPESNNISQMKSFWENSIQYPKTITSEVKPEAKDRNENKPNVHSEVFSGKVTDVTNGVDGNQHVEMKNDQESDNFYLENNTTNPQEVERNGSNDEVVSVKQPTPNAPLQTYPESKVSSLDQPDTHVQSIQPQSPKAEKTSVAQSSQVADPKTCGNQADIICKPPGSSSKDSAQTPKRKDTDICHSQRQNHPRQDTTAERIKQLKSFWEQETSKTSFSCVKPKAMWGSKLNKRFTISEFDLRTIGSDGEDSYTNLSGLPLNQRIDKVSPTHSSSRAQFSSLMGFWDDTTTDAKPKSPKRQVNSPQPPEELSSSKLDARSLSPVETSPSRRILSPSKATNDNQNNLSELGSPKELIKILKDSNRDDKAARPPPTSTKGVRAPRRKKDSSSPSSSRFKSMRRATSMFALVDPEEAKLKILVSPVHSQSRKLSIDHTQNIRQGSEGTETPLARAFVPRDYSHYLGTADEPGTPASGDEVGGGFRTPVRTSTPTVSEDRSFKKTIKMSPRHVWTNNSADAEPESPVHSTSESWSKSRNFLNWKTDDEEENPVRKALRRAEARPRGLAKSMEDLSGSPRLERRQEQKTDIRRNTDGPLTAPSSPAFLDQDHLKKKSKSVPSFLQKELSGSVLTMYSGDFGSVEVQGSIHFSINYIQKLNEFHIFIAQCRDLAAVDPKRGRSDPYVKSYLVPDKIHLGKKKTSVKKKTLNPTFNEILRYRVGIDYLRTQTLVLSVWHHDTFGRNNFLGEVDMDLSKWNFDHTHMNDLALRARTTAPSSGRGEMRLAVCFLPKAVHNEAKEAPTTGEIHIWVKECKSLPLIRATIDPFVKCFVLPDTSHKSRQKTRVLRRTTDPVFNHTMVYDGIREMDLGEACVELTVWDRDKLASSLLGGLRLGSGTGKSYGSPVDWMDSTPDEVALWKQMVATPNEWVEGVLPLRMLSSSKTASK